MWWLTDELIVAREDSSMLQHVLSKLKCSDDFFAVLAHLKDFPEAESENSLRVFRRNSGNKCLLDLPKLMAQIRVSKVARAWA
jgi:hypothetical protein